MGLDPVKSPSHESADGSGRGVENSYLVAIDDFPEPIFARLIGSALIHHNGGSIGKRSIDDVAVASDPADVGSAPVDVVAVQVKHETGSPHGLEQVAGRSV